jgi:hypothetical protein
VLSSIMILSLPAVAIFSFLERAWAANGPAFSTGPVNQPAGNFIREAEATVILPQTPSPPVGDISFWVGMGTSNGDLIQGITNNFPKDTLRNICSNLAGGYCVKAYVLKRGAVQ